MKTPVAAILLFAASPLCAQDARPLSWDDAVRLLNSSNLQKIQSRLSVESASDKVLSARGGLLPQLSLNGVYDKDSSNYGYNSNYSAGVSASQPLFSPALSAQWRKTRADLRQAQYQDALLDAQLRSSLRQAYADLLYAQESVDLAANIVKRRQENVELINLKYKAGIESNAALLETQSLLDSSAFDLEHDRRELTLAQRKLNQLLGRSPAKPARVEKLFDLPAAPADFSAFTPLVDAHPQLELDRAALDSALESLNVTQSAFLPTASANLTYDKTGYSWPTTDNYWTYGVTVSWTVFNGGSTLYDTRSSRAQAESARTEIDRIHDDIYISAEDDFMGWREAQSYVKVSQSLLDAASARAWLLHNQYLSGQASYFEWRDAESQYINYQLQMVTARDALAKAYASFLQALGKGDYPL
jgi:outer membrane protein TolC